MTIEERIVLRAEKIAKKYKLDISCIWEQEKHFEQTVKEDTY